MMKKLLFFAAACVALVACTPKNNVINHEPENLAFQAGQEVTISAAAGTNANTRKAPVRKINSQVGADNISFAWEAGDTVLVTVGTATAVFKVTNISADGKSADFTGTMPAAGTQFDVQFPVNPLPLDTQYYAGEDVLPKNVLPFEAKNCTIGQTATLTPTKAVLQLNIADGPISTDTVQVQMWNSQEEYSSVAPKYTYTLVIKNSVSLSSVQPFFLVVEPGTYYFEVLWHKYGMKEWGPSSRDTQTTQTFTAGECLKMADYGCLAAGTKITMADGTTKNIEDIVEGDMVRTFDHEAGTISSEKICFVWKGETKECPLNLTFASGKTLGFIFTHDLLLEDTRKYVRVNSGNVAYFVGKRFYNAETGTWDELVGYAIGKEPVAYYCIYSAYHINCIAEGLLTCPDDVDFCLNIYELDANLKADADQLAMDIETYGLYDIYVRYPELANHPDAQCSNELFRYVYIAVGKGLVTLEELHTRLASCLE